MPFESIKDIYKRIARAAMRSDRDPHEVRLVAVTKEVDADTIREAVHSGLREFGESRVQAAAEKIREIRTREADAGVVWHLIGHLQRNKAKASVELFDMVQSVDSLELARDLDRYAEAAGKMQRILIQVKLADEETKHGILQHNIIEIIQEISAMGNLVLQGLMTIPPFFEDAEKVRPFFAKLRVIREEAAKRGYPLKELSMGMSHDFEVAIEEGATIVRIGTAIFGERRK